MRVRESEREREHWVLTVTPAFLVILKVGLEDEDKVGINEKVEASFCSFRENAKIRVGLGSLGIWQSDPHCKKMAKSI